MEYSALLLFIPTIMMMSATPGLCMTLAFTLGVKYGVRTTLWMMLGELLGVALVVTATLSGVAYLLLTYPDYFTLVKIAGACYLFYVAWQMWQSASKMRYNPDAVDKEVNPMGLVSQGFVTAISNPKGWAFTVSLLPGFLNQSLPLTPQILTILLVMLISEFIFMMIYATGGSSLKHFLNSAHHLSYLNHGVAILILGVGFWMLFS